MAVKLFEVYGEALLKGKDQIQNDLTKIDNKGSKVGTTFSKIGSGIAKFGKVFAAATAAAGVALAGLVKHSIDAALELESTQAKFNTVFGEYKDQMLETIDEFQELTPATQAAVQSMASGIQDLLIPMGFMRGEATEMTGEYLHLVGALTNFNNATHSAEDVASAFQSALTGEMESLKALGIQIDQETLNQKVLEMGLADTKDEITKQDKAMALLELAYEQSGDALAAYNEESLDTRTELDLLKTKFEDMSAELGEVFLPFLGELVDIAEDEMPTVKETMSGVFEALLPVMQTIAENVLPALNEILPIFADIFKNVVGPAIEQITPLFTQLAVTFLPKLEKLFNSIGTEVLPALVDSLGQIFEALGPVADIFIELISEEVMPYLKEIFEKLGPIIAGLFEAFGSLWDSLEPVREIFSEFADETLDLIVTLLDLILDIVNLLAPAFEALAPVIEMIAKAFQPLAFVLSTILNFLTAIIGSISDIISADWDSLGNRWKTFGSNVSTDWTEMAGELKGSSSSSSGSKPLSYYSSGVYSGSFSGAYATGGRVLQDGIYRVGELGPEEVYLPEGAYVKDAEDTAKSAGLVVNINNNNNPDAFQVWRQAEKASIKMALGVV